MYMVFHACYKLYIMSTSLNMLYDFSFISRHILMYYVLEHVPIDIFLV